MSIDFFTEASELTAVLTERLATYGPKNAMAIAEAADILLEWLGYLHFSESTGHCDDFLDGARSLVLETIASGSAGLHRSSMFSMRGQIDLVLSWLYFKDHPIEWQLVERENKGYMLRGDVIGYLENHYPNFKKKFSVLRGQPGDGQLNPYKTLSAHIHAVGNAAIPLIAGFSDVVADQAVCAELPAIQGDTTEYISDVLIAIYGSKWASLPQPITKSIRKRFPPEKVSIILS